MPYSGLYSTVYIQFWTGECAPIGACADLDPKWPYVGCPGAELYDSRRSSSEDRATGWTKHPDDGWWGTELTIPPGAKWMTIVANDGVGTKWRLS